MLARLAPFLFVRLVPSAIRIRIYLINLPTITTEIMVLNENGKQFLIFDDFYKFAAI